MAYLDDVNINIGAAVSKCTRERVYQTSYPVVPGADQGDTSAVHFAPAPHRGREARPGFASPHR